MSWCIPKETTRLQATMFVSNAELQAVGRDVILRHVRKQIAEDALSKLVEDCTKTVSNYPEHNGYVLELDVYVLTPLELHKMLVEARTEGNVDALRWHQDYWRK